MKHIRLLLVILLAQIDAVIGGSTAFLLHLALTAGASVNPILAAAPALVAGVGAALAADTPLRGRPLTHAAAEAADRVADRVGLATHEG